MKALTINDAVVPTEPCRKVVKIHHAVFGVDIAAGECVPHFDLPHSDVVRWHLHLKPQACGPVDLWLLHGHGGSVAEAVADMVMRERQRLVAMTKHFEKIESALGTLGLDEDELRKKFAEGAQP